VFRLSFFAVVLIGVLAQIGSYLRVGERLGMLRERERVARDLHDGPVQELALLRMLIDQLAARIQDPVVTQLDERSAAVLAEWRAAITAGGTRGGPLPEVLDRTMRSMLAGTGIAFEVEVGPDVTVSAEQRDDLIALIREAVSNAARHGRPTRIRVTVRGQPFSVVIVDDGAGLASRSEHAGGGHGMRTMRNRANALGGELTVSVTADGTEVSVHAGR
jgi:signal transduction histidine kinase